MLLIAKSGETASINVDFMGTVIENCTLTVRDGQTFGEAVSLSDCTYEFCCNVRNEPVSEDRDSLNVPLTAKIPSYSEA